MLSWEKGAQIPGGMAFKGSQPCICLFLPSLRFLRNQVCGFLLRARMALCLQEHLANEGRPNEAKQMVRGDSPVAPCEPAQGERGQSRVGLIS